MTVHDHSDHEHRGPGYASPQAAREQPPEQFVYVAAPTYGEILHRTEMPNIGDELHHFGWNACSKGWLTKLDRQPDGSYALDPGFFVDFHEQADGARPHEIHLPGGDCTTELFQ
ncbi:MAG: selenium-binding protein SBP56-related protein [Solirubrobacteraceae bacterium]